MKNFALFLCIIAFLLMLTSCSNEKTPEELATECVIKKHQEILNETVLAKVHAWPIIQDEVFISELKFINPAYVKGDIIVIYGGKYMVDSIIVLDNDGHYTGDLNILDDDD